MESKSCEGCVHFATRGKPWYSVEPHPCTNCNRRNIKVDNYTAKGEAPWQGPDWIN